MIQFRDFVLARGGRRLIEVADLQIHPGWRVGLVGANGSGKSSLFAVLRGEWHADHGECAVPPAWKIGTVAQETPPLARAALEYVLDGDVGLRATEKALQQAEAAHDGHRVAELHVRLTDIDGYSARSRAAALLAGLGFSEADLLRPVSDFSGGWRMRLNLAQALVSRADLLLLDEPTNHLDLDAVVWLEKWLAGYQGTLIVVSHDRDFLDGCVTHIAHIAAQRLTLYAGNYSTFEQARAAQLAVQQALYEKQQRTIARMESFIARFRAKATKARQAQSRLKALDRMERMSPAHADAPFDFHFPASARAPDPLLALDGVAAGYGGVAVLRDVSLALRPGARLGLLGPNGAGKSTLVRLLAGELQPLAGRRVEGRGLAAGYFAQHQLEQLRADESPLAHLARRHPATREQELRDFLGGFDFRGTMADTPAASFSGGEKSRLALALLVRERPNLLLLDEPTNHLDLEMRHALTAALAGFEGSMVLVSHDRALLRTVCDAFLLVADGRVQEFDGNLEDYLAWLAARRGTRSAADAPAGKLERREARERTARHRRDALSRRRPLLQEAERLDRELAQLVEEKQYIERQLADPVFYERPDVGRMQQLAARREELVRRTEYAEQRWLELHAALDQIADP